MTNVSRKNFGQLESTSTKTRPCFNLSMYHYIIQKPIMMTLLLLQLLIVLRQSKTETRVSFND